MRDAQRRLEQIEYDRLWRLAAKAGRPYGLSAEVVLAEERRVLALPEAEQRQMFQRFYDELSDEQLAELNTIKRRHARIFSTCPMRSLEGRLHRLETQRQARQPVWSTDVESARSRAVARIRRDMGERLGITKTHPALQSADALLAGDTPAQQQADLDTLRVWGRAHPEALSPDDGWAARFTARLDEMAQRLEAGKGVP